MKKLQIGMMLSALLMLAGCTKPVAAKEAATDLVNGLIYAKDTEKIQDSFNLDGGLIEELPSTSVVTDLKESFGLGDEYNPQLTLFSETVTDNLNKKTSFKVKVTEETSSQAKLELLIIGLEELDDGQVTNILDAELEKKMADITAETTEEQVNKLVNDISLETLATLLANQQGGEATTVKLTLKVDPEEKNKWVIQDKEAFVMALNQAFSG